MSQVRQRPIKRQQPVKLRDRREVIEAVVGVAIVVIGTLLAVWLMRPGGLASRQPRAAWWIIISVSVIGGWIWWAYHPATRFKVPEKRRLFVGVVLALLLCAGLAGIFWPGGLLRETPKGLQIETPTMTPDTAGSTSLPSSTDSTGAPVSSTPSSSGEAGASSTTGAGNASSTSSVAPTSSTGG